MPSFTFRNLKPLALPVDIVESELADLVGPQSIGHQKKKDRVVAAPLHRPPIDPFQHAPHFVPSDGTGHSGQTVDLRHLDRRTQVLAHDSLTVAEPQEHP